jgi:ketosteroid isomerase-like protein
VEGRAAVQEYLRGYPDLLDVREIPEQVVHQSVDPDVVIVEFSVNGIVVATGRPYHMRYIAVITARDGEIQHYRDYWSPAAAAEAMGGAAELNSAFSGGSDE